MYELTPGASLSSNLTLDDDGARANAGYPWRIPTVNEYNELFSNCEMTWTRVEGVPGVLFRSRINGAEIFFPAVGYFTGTTLSNYRSRGYYCTSEYINAQTTSIMFIRNLADPSLITFQRYFGVSMRPVFDPV